MRARSLQQFSASPEQPFPAIATDATSIHIDRIPFRRLTDPRLTPAIRFAEVGANLERLQIVHHRAAVVALVSANFLNDRHPVVGDGGNGFELLRGFRQCLLATSSAAARVCVCPIAMPRIVVRCA